MFEELLGELIDGLGGGRGVVLSCFWDAVSIEF